MSHELARRRYRLQYVATEGIDCKRNFAKTLFMAMKVFILGCNQLFEFAHIRRSVSGLPYMQMGVAAFRQADDGYAICDRHHEVWNCTFVELTRRCKVESEGKRPWRNRLAFEAPSH